RALELLRVETHAMMQQVGAPSIKHLVPAMVRRAGVGAAKALRGYSVTSPTRRRKSPTSAPAKMPAPDRARAVGGRVSSVKTRQPRQDDGAVEPLKRSVIPATPSARLMPTCPMTDSGCSITDRREPPIKTLAPAPRPSDASALAPT